MLFRHFIVIYVYHSSRDIVYLIQKQYKQAIFSRLMLEELRTRELSDEINYLSSFLAMESEIAFTLFPIRKFEN